MPLMITKSFKKIAASIMAVSAIAVGAVSMTASAYSPTITKSFGSSAKATLYADSSYGKDCTVSVTYHGTTKYGSGYGYANAKNSASGSGTRASSYHTAGGYSTNISY